MAEQQNSMFQQKYQMIINQASVREVMEEYGLKIVKKGKDFKTVCPILRFWFRNRGMRYVKNCRIVTIC